MIVETMEDLVKPLLAIRHEKEKEKQVWSEKMPPIQTNFCLRSYHLNTLHLYINTYHLYM